VTDKKKELDKLKNKMLKADLPLKDTAQHLVFGQGPCDPLVFFVGEAPGAKEDAQGLPFVGTAGKHLESLFNSIGLSRQDVYITSILKYRPPKNRSPSLWEIKAHTPFLISQIKIIQPSLLVTLGNFATRFILSGFNTEKMSGIPGITQIHGQEQIIQVENKNMIVLPLFHPAAICYKRPLLDLLMHDFQKIKHYLRG
jgi:uracil-DNA glycosylase